MRVTSSTQDLGAVGPLLGTEPLYCLALLLAAHVERADTRQEIVPTDFSSFFCSARPARIFKDTLKTSSAYHLAITY